jgi:hypothetical protein
VFFISPGSGSLARTTVNPPTLVAANVVPVARTAAESVERLRAWASGLCLSADGEGGIYQRNGVGDSVKPGRKIRRADPSNN